jgi:hypothetical protein
MDWDEVSLLLAFTITEARCTSASAQAFAAQEVHLAHFELGTANDRLTSFLSNKRRVVETKDSDCYYSHLLYANPGN